MTHFHGLHGLKKYNEASRVVREFAIGLWQTCQRTSGAGVDGRTVNGGRLCWRGPYQCRRRVCRKADRPSMSRSTPIVRIAHGANTQAMPMAPAYPFIVSPIRNTIDQSTSDNSENTCACVRVGFT